MLAQDIPVGHIFINKNGTYIFFKGRYSFYKFIDRTFI